MTTDESQIIRTAHARAEGAPIPLTIDFGEMLGGQQTFRFMRSYGMPIAQALADVEEAKTFTKQLVAYRHFLVTLAVPDDRSELERRIDSGELDFTAIEAMSHRLLGELTGRRPTNPGSSSDGSGQAGQPSTAGAPPAPSTPLFSPPIDS